MNGPFKLKGMDFGNSPLNQNEIPTGGGEGESKHAQILAKYGWGGKTRKEVKSTIRFSTSNQKEKQKKRDFYKIYGELNR